MEVARYGFAAIIQHTQSQCEIYEPSTSAKLSLSLHGSNRNARYECEQLNDYYIM